MIGNIAAGLYGVGVTPSTNSYESIATVSVGAGGSSTISFTSIPSTYKHLQIRTMSRVTGAGSGAQDSYIYFNSDTTDSNYYSHQLYGTGSSAGAGGGNSSGNGGIISQTNGGTGSVFGVGIMDILDYATANKNRVCRTLGGVDSNSTNGFIELTSVLWNNTAAITSITIKPTSGTDFMQYSSFALYGIKD